MSWETTILFLQSFVERGYHITLLKGIEGTLLLTLIATIIGLLIGVVIAMIQVLKLPKKFLTLEKCLKIFAKLYIDIIRGTPAIVQVSFIWFVVFATSSWPKLWVGGIAFGINSGAYMAELMRAGIQGIDKGQMEAGRSLGLGYFETMKEIILPQAFRQMLPALVSEFIVLIKETAVISIIGGLDITKAGNVMISTSGNAAIPLILVAITYMILTGIFTKIMRTVEKRLSQGR
jgi:polar amino acid transport system permease protein